MNITLDSCCRICLGNQNLQSIFQDHRDIPIREKIVYCASVQISQDDCLPEMICTQCLFYLDIAYVFKTVCEATDKKLRDLQLAKEIGEFDEDEYNYSQECITCDESENTSEALKIGTSNIKSNSENNNIFKQAYSNNTQIIENNTKVLINEPAELKCFTSDHNIKTELDENIVSALKAKENIAVLLVKEETHDVAAGSEKSVALIASKVTRINIEGDKQNIFKNDLIEDDPVQNVDNFPRSEISKHTLEDADYSLEKSMLKENAKDKVGRHIAKKITGKFPQKLHQNNSNTIADRQKIFEDKLKDVNLSSKVQDGTPNFEDILENDLPMVVFEETVVTDNDSFPYFTQNIVNESNAHAETNDNDKISDKIKINKSGKKITRGRRNEKPKIKIKISPMTLRKGNRKVNVFDDNSKSSNMKKKKKIRELTKNTVRGISVKRTKDGFKCDICNKSFPFRSHLIRHLNMHTGIKRYSCEYCKQKFINNYNLSVHMLKHTGEFPLKCDLCNKGFPNPSLLKRHTTSHTGETNFQCRYCSVKFRQSSSLKLHEKMHLHRPSYHCDICYKVFSYTNSLAAHKKLHFTAKRFSCNICLTTFSRKSSLIRHMEGHTKSKKIKCKFCDISFNSKNNYYSHLKTHCKYKCDMCDEGFRYKTNLVIHIKKHKDGLKCEQCYKPFQNKAQLVRHLEKHIK